MIKMIRKLMAVFLLLLTLMEKSLVCYAAEITLPGSLYAQSAVLMDGNSGRILYEKNGQEFLPNASTTKILTCILALENAAMEEVVTVSSYAESMPDVQLHIKEGEQYRLGDLLYSLMLESHNDVAVAIAEHVAGSCDKFADMMNKKAGEIGCKNTFFLTPNGLDAKQEITLKNGLVKIKNHGTTAEDLALLMRYCIKESEKKDEFLKITSTPSHSFGNIKGDRSFYCQNHNSFLTMMEGAVSGKTGFTAKAGYCYVGALERNGKSYIVALLACGWPNNKTYKWKDSQKLMEYGLKYYEPVSLEHLEEQYENQMTIEVIDGAGEELGKPAVISLKKETSKVREILVGKEEKISVQVEKEKLAAPVQRNAYAGKIIYLINDKEILEEKLFCEKEIEKIDFVWYLRKIWCFFLLIDI